jgi:glycosyltransferase involved in cell wall biosynthesis
VPPRATHPLVSVIVPTRGRPQLLTRALESVLEQTVADFEIVIVDDASEKHVEVPDDERIRLVRLDVNRGIAGALTAGARVGRGRWITHLDDDDVFLPHMLEVSLEAASNATLPRPIAVVSGLEMVDSPGRVLQRRFPPTRPRGSHYSLEPLERGCAYETRNTMFVERDVLERVGFWDERFRSSARHELFLRLNPVCSILGLAVVTYRQVYHRGYHVSADTRLKHESFKLLEEKHRGLFEAHPRRYAQYLVGDAARLVTLGRRTEAVAALARATRRAPATAIVRSLRLFSSRASQALRTRGHVRRAA